MNAQEGRTRASSNSGLGLVTVAVAAAMLAAVMGIRHVSLVEKRIPRWPSAVRLLPDPGYIPNRGDRAILYSYSPVRDRVMTTDAAKSLKAYEAYEKALRVGEIGDIEKLVENGRVIRLDPYTPVLVLEVIPPPLDGWTVRSAVVRVAGGEHRSLKLWVPGFQIAKLIPNPDYVPPGGDKTSEPLKARQISADVRAAQAATCLDVAENLRKAGWMDKAEVYYRKLIKEFAGHPEAKTAAERIKTLPKK